MTVLEQNACNAIIAMAKKDEPDYWTKLEHQYAGMAMQALIADASYSDTEGPKYLVEACAIIAHALVEKMKEERK